MTDIAAPRVLLAEDDAAHGMLIEEVLRPVGVDIERVTTGAACCERLLGGGYAALILDVRLPDMDGFQIQKWASGRSHIPPVIFVTADDDVEHAVNAMRAGASHYVVKKRNYLRHVEGAVRAALEIQSVPRSDDVSSDFRILGSSPAIERVRRQVREFGASSAPVLIVGETGTGKELVARAIHQASRWVDGPFVAVNCAALSQRIVERWGSAFDHETAVQRGDPISLAAAGTLFLDEVGEVPRKLQGVFLRLIEGSGPLAVGSRSMRHPPRIIASTKQDLDRQVLLGELRVDVYHRINGLRLKLPPLRDRRADIPVLANHFMQLHAPPGLDVSIARDAIRQLLAAPWIGNVRELEQTIQRTLAGWTGGTVHRFDMGPLPTSSLRAQEGGITREDLTALLIQSRGRLDPVAEALGVSKRTVQRRMVLFGIRVRDMCLA